MKIEGVVITELKIIRDERGQVMHMMRNDSDVFKSFEKSTFQLFLKTKLKLGICIKKLP